MATNYNKLVREQLERILTATTGINHVSAELKPATECANLPAVVFQVTANSGDRSDFSTTGERRIITIQLVIYARADATYTAAENIERLEANVRAAIEDDNETETSRTNTGGVITLWKDLDTQEFGFTPERGVNYSYSQLTVDVWRDYTS